MTKVALCTTLLLAMLAVSACKRQSDTAPAATSSSASPAAPASTPSPMQGVVPHDAEAPAAKPSTGPAEAGTAVGGMVGNQDQGGASSKAPEASGGDGAKK
ncbi:MAG: hypothetical protein ACRYGK_08915 [Janthinobacterium lividum]